MNPALIVPAINGLFTALELLLPKLEQAKRDGEITPEQQAEVHARFLSLKEKADGQFSGPEWAVTP